MGATDLSRPLLDASLIKEGMLPDGTPIWVWRATEADVPTLHKLIRTEIGEQTASLTVMQKVRRHNQDTLWGIFKRGRGAYPFDMIGCCTFLFPNIAGLAALQSDSLDTLDPRLDLLTPGGEKPAAIYGWGIVARKMGRIVVPLVTQALDPVLYAGLPLYGRAGTAGGLAMLSRATPVVDKEAKVGSLVSLASVDDANWRKGPTS
jgi:hypothetical protein